MRIVDVSVPVLICILCVSAAAGAQDLGEALVVTATRTPEANAPSKVAVNRGRRHPRLQGPRRSAAGRSVVRPLPSQLETGRRSQLAKCHAARPRTFRQDRARLLPDAFARASEELASSQAAPADDEGLSLQYASGGLVAGLDARRVFGRSQDGEQAVIRDCGDDRAGHGCGAWRQSGVSSAVDSGCIGLRPPG